MTFIDTRSKRFYDRLQRRRLELTQGTPDQSVDDEAMYLNVAARPGCGDGATCEFDIVASNYERLWRLCIKHLGMTMDGAGLSLPQPPPPPPPPPHDQHQPPQIDPADPPQQGDNVERETQEWLTRDEQLDVTFACLRYARFAVEMFCEGVAETHFDHYRGLVASLLEIDYHVCLKPSVEGSLYSNFHLISLGNVHAIRSCVGTVAWRPVLEDPSNLQIFFDYYAIAKPPISKEGILEQKEVLVVPLSLICKGKCGLESLGASHQVLQVLLTFILPLERISTTELAVFTTPTACSLCATADWWSVGSVALSVGDWFFDRVGVSAIDCPYPCDNTCHNLVFK
ncbi:hypothetical protein Scep_004490 [Stephania cephalantha]|uniref:Uncharacterized protein n=1 Tax=Stephania cephalantha TaxID=152367 RepID=A0AAP0PZ56_9MAGN